MWPSIRQQQEGQHQLLLANWVSAQGAPLRQSAGRPFQKLIAKPAVSLDRTIPPPRGGTCANTTKDLRRFAEGIPLDKQSLAGRFIPSQFTIRWAGCDRFRACIAHSHRRRAPSTP